MLILNRRTGLLCIAAPLGLSLASSSAVGAKEPSDPGSMEIVGGEETKACHFPSVAFLKVSAGACTGTLVHPKVLTTANHCIGRNGEKIKATFGESHRGGKFTVSATCTGSTGGDRGGPPGKDFAFCVLDKEVTNVPIVPILMGCEVEALKKGNEIALVGFGATSAGGPGVGTKRQVLTPIHSDFGKGGYDTEILVGHREKGACSGDSGGPAFVDLRTIPEFADKPGAGWRVFGVTSRKGPGGGMCASTTYYGGIHKWVEWVEKESGIDITPCFDADGTWAPSETCKGFPDPQAGGSWDSCDPGKVSGWSHVCGDNPHDTESGENSEEPGEEENSSKSEEPEDSKGSSEDRPESGDEDSSSNEEEDDGDDEAGEAEDDENQEESSAKSSNGDEIETKGGCRVSDVDQVPGIGWMLLALLLAPLRRPLRTYTRRRR